MSGSRLVPKKLVLTCAAARSDTMTVDDDTIREGVRVAYVIVTEAGEGSARAALDEERARALFNWLGVWLHQPHP